MSKRIPRLLLTNDDGINAPGFAVLEEIAHEMADEVWVVAPEHDRSGVGGAITITNPLRVSPQGQRRWSISGTPADCVALGLSHFMKDAKPTYIFSGINAGGNLGDEVNLSGTLGAVFTGFMLGIPSIGISQIFGASRKNINWPTARTIAPKVLQHVIDNGWPQDACLSINIPDRPANQIKGFTWARQSRGNIIGIDAHERQDLREGAYYWLRIRREEGTTDDTHDVAITEMGDVAVTVLRLDRSIPADLPPVRFQE